MAYLSKQTTSLRQKNLLTLKKRMQGVRNEMEFVEILAQFWPLPSMIHRMERLEERLSHLSLSYRQMIAEAG